MSSILSDLGIDKDEFDWYDLAICRGMDTNLFFDKYETDINIAKNIDEACMSCPVSKMCYEVGVENDERRYVHDPEQQRRVFLRGPHLTE